MHGKSLIACTGPPRDQGTYPRSSHKSSCWLLLQTCSQTARTNTAPFYHEVVHGESPNAGRVKSKRDSVECFADLDLAGGVQATDESGMQATDIKNLSSELTTITNWYQLGINLNLQIHELNKIQQDHAHQGNDRQRLEMLALWLRCTPNAVWEDVVSALQQMGENRVAENIRQKHGLYKCLVNNHVREGETISDVARPTVCEFVCTVIGLVYMYAAQSIFPHAGNK